jgi:hypothetical protein
MVSPKLQEQIHALRQIILEPYRLGQGVLGSEAEYLDDTYVPEAISSPEAVKAEIVRRLIRSIHSNMRHGRIADWSGAACGIAQYLLLPTAISEVNMPFARDAVVRISGWYYTSNNFWTRFRPTAEFVVEHLWGDIDRFRDEQDNRIWAPPGIKRGPSPVKPVTCRAFTGEANEDPDPLEALRPTRDCLLPNGGVPVIRPDKGRPFVMLRRSPADALQSLNEIENPALRNFLTRAWYAEDNGFISAQCACSLFCFATRDPRVRAWFDRELCSDTHDVTFAAFDQHVGEEKAKEWRGTSADLEDDLSGMLPGSAL